MNEIRIKSNPEPVGVVAGGGVPGVSGIEALNRVSAQSVMRNTYWLLALSMVPTILGAWIGVKTGFMHMMGPFAMIAFVLIGGFGFIYGINKMKNSAAAIPLLLGFTLFEGLVLSGILSAVLSLRNGSELVMLSFACTAAAFFGMATLSTVIKRDISSWGKFLFIGLVMMLVASIANVFLHSTALTLTLASLGVGLFSAYLLYDLKRIVDGGESNYVLATLSVYLDLVNIFVSLLQLFGILGSSSD